MEKKQLDEKLGGEEKTNKIIQNFLDQVNGSTSLVTPTHVQQEIYDDVKLHKHHLNYLMKYLFKSGNILEIPSSPKGTLIAHIDNIDDIIGEVKAEKEIFCPYCETEANKFDDYQQHLTDCVK